VISNLMRVRKKLKEVFALLVSSDLWILLDQVLKLLLN